MLGHFLTLLSAAAFAAFILCLSILLTSAAGREFRWRALPFASWLPLLAAFYFIPIGSLPSFIAFEYGGFCAAALLFLSSVLKARRCASYRWIWNFIAFPIVFCAAWAALAFFAFHAGVPGALASLGTYSVVPLWNVAGGVARSGMIFIFIALLCSMPKNPRSNAGFVRLEPDGVADSLHALLCAAFVAALLLPWNFSELAGIFGLQAFFIDFVFFWAKCALVCLAAGGARHIAGYAPGFRAGALPPIFTLFGAGCIVAETLGLFQ